MSIRLRLTLLYSTILALTLILFGLALYFVQAQWTLNWLKNDLSMNGDRISQSILFSYTHPNQQEPNPPPPPPLENLSSNQAFQGLREREIVRVLDTNGKLVASPSSTDQTALPLSAAGLRALQDKNVWWQIASTTDRHLLIYDIPMVQNGQVLFIVQVARSLTERDQSLAALGRTLLIAGILAIIAAFGIGWFLSGITLRPIHHITQTAREIGDESDFTRRVDYSGPNDEIGELATTFNSMLARLQEAYQRVSQALGLQREFVSDVSHELRTPLTTVRGNLALLRHDPPLPAEEQADILTDLVDESDRLIRLINDLLVLARADTERSLLREPVLVRPLVEEVCRQARLLDRRQIVEQAQDVTVLGDRDAIKQVLLILLDNALKYSQGEIVVTAEAAGKQVVLSVCDQGSGIAPDTIEHVFDRFYRGELDPSVPGFGLGLPIAKALVEAQGGQITLESQVDHGTRARVQLERAD
ncbi:MAG: sensor protein CutS [Chloroflexi bacterium]|jgi:signal transduction histidine kinase|nr:sensor protein CutS [Chloroflexota bacterium]